MPLTWIKYLRRRMCESQGMKTSAFLACIASADRKPAVDFAGKRLTREWKTMATMIHIRCRDHREPQHLDFSFEH